jgi:hypothetical protein
MREELSKIDGIVVCSNDEVRDLFQKYDDTFVGIRCELHIQKGKCNCNR